MNVLLVEDDPAVSRLLRAMIEGMSLCAWEASNGAAALTILEREAIHLVISDIEMPVMDGLTLTQHIRARAWPHYVFIVLISGTERDYVADILEAGADDFITKPLRASHIRARIQGAGRIAALEGQLKAANAKTEALLDTLSGDLQQAQALQKATMPIGGDYGAVEFCPFWMPSTYVSGDCFNLFEVGPGLFAFYLIDVAGHGAGAALQAAALHARITPSLFEVALDDSGDHRPSAVATILNGEHLAKEGEGFFTALLGLYDVQSNRLAVCIAGGMPPIHLSNGHSTLLGTGGFPIGLVDHADYEDLHLALPPDASLILFSDGVTDSLGGKDPDHGLQQFRTILAERLSGPLPLATGISDLGDAILTHLDGASPLDDLTVLGLRFTPAHLAPRPAPHRVKGEAQPACLSSARPSGSQHLPPSPQPNHA